MAWSALGAGLSMGILVLHDGHPAQRSSRGRALGEAGHRVSAIRSASSSSCSAGSSFFTESTLSAVLPLLTRQATCKTAMAGGAASGPSSSFFNIIGTFIFAWLISHRRPVRYRHQQGAEGDIAEEAIKDSFCSDDAMKSISSPAG